MLKERFMKRLAVRKVKADKSLLNQETIEAIDDFCTMMNDTGGNVRKSMRALDTTIGDCLAIRDWTEFPMWILTHHTPEDLTDNFENPLCVQAFDDGDVSRQKLDELYDRCYDVMRAIEDFERAWEYATNTLREQGSKNF